MSSLMKPLTLYGTVGRPHIGISMQMVRDELKRLKLTFAEFHAIFDALRGVHIAEPDFLLLPDDILSQPQILNKWGVTAEALSAKLEGLGDVQKLVLLEVRARFWEIIQERGGDRNEALKLALSSFNCPEGVSAIKGK
jgi:hypothetical protein